ncbi:hypothetical protein HEP_00537100, partial [Hepatocystis sp. ex Piliocolobus tephrosceles]
SSIKNSIVLELVNGQKLSLNEINCCEIIFRLSCGVKFSKLSNDNINDLNEYEGKLVEEEEFKKYLKDYLLSENKKIDDNFYETIENKMLQKGGIFFSEKLKFTDFLLFYILKKNKINVIKDKYNNLCKWYKKNDISVKEDTMNMFTNTNFIQQIIEEDLKKKKHSF